MTTKTATTITTTTIPATMIIITEEPACINDYADIIVVVGDATLQCKIYIRLSLRVLISDVLHHTDVYIIVVFAYTR